MRHSGIIGAALIACPSFLPGTGRAFPARAPDRGIAPRAETHEPRPPRHQPWRTRFYVGFAYLGVTAVIAGRGPFAKLIPGFPSSGWVGLRFSPKWGAELGFTGSLHPKSAGPTEQPSRPRTGEASLVSVSLGLRYFLLPRSRTFAPYLLAGIAFNAISADWLHSAYEEAKSQDIIGGGFHAGVGFDYHAAYWLTFGVRARYRGMFLGRPKCSEDDIPCDDPVYRKKSTLHAVTGELTLQLVF